MNDQYDLVIVGAGLVGTSLVAALKKSGFRIAVVETHLPALNQFKIDSRPLSLNYQSQKIFKELNIWQDLESDAAPILRVHISEQHRLGILNFRASEEKVPALGYVVPLTSLQNLLYQKAAQDEQVKFIMIQKLIHIEKKSANIVISVQTHDGLKNLETPLLIAADGAQSPTRTLLKIPSTEKFYDDVAQVFLFELSKPHQYTAYERFTHKGAIAILPLKNTHHCRLVWTISSDFAKEIALWSDEQISEHLRQAMHDRLGPWRLVERGQSFRLSSVFAEKQILPGVVLLGNAAHTLYPLAAQGFNLGLRDAVSLAALLIQAKDHHQNWGSEAVLQSYVEKRSQDQRWISRFSNGLTPLFELQLPGLSLLRGAGLLAVDLIPPLKHRLARRLMGMEGAG